MNTIISIKNFYDISHNDEKILIDDIFYSKLIHDNAENSSKVQSNFKLIRDSSNQTKKIYDKFLETSKLIFGNFTLSDSNKDCCWSLCTNKNYWCSVPHNHFTTSVINSVFYLKVPKHQDNYCGEILFFDNNEWKAYQPEPYELLIMPNYLLHDTEYHDTEDWRISLNFEIICNETINWDTNYLKCSNGSLYNILEFQ